MKQPRARLALRLAACAVVGAAATVLVALGLTLWCPAHQRHVVEGRERVPWPGVPAPEWPSVADEWSAVGAMPSVHHRWYAFDKAGGREFRWDVWRVGWPFLAMSAQEREHRTVGSPWDSKSSGLRIPRVLSRLRSSSYASNQLPITPLWPGFAVNIAFYGTLAFLLWTAPGFVRRARRRRGGRCVVCGYELKGLAGGAGGVCPECGGGSTGA